MKSEMRLCNIPWSVMVSCNGEYWIPTTTSIIGEKRETSRNKLDPRTKLVQNLIRVCSCKEKFLEWCREGELRGLGGLEIFGEVAK